MLMSESAAGPQHHEPVFLPAAQAKGQGGEEPESDVRPGHIL